MAHVFSNNNNNHGGITFGNHFCIYFRHNRYVGIS